MPPSKVVPAITAMMMASGCRPTRSPMIFGEMTRPSSVCTTANTPSTSERMLPVAVLHERQRQRGDANHNRAEKRNHREQHRREAEQKRVVHADDEKADRVKHRIANRHQHLPAKKCDEILLDGIEDENHFVLRARILQLADNLSSEFRCRVSPAENKTHRRESTPIPPAGRNRRRLWRCGPAARNPSAGRLPVSQSVAEASAEVLFRLAGGLALRSPLTDCGCGKK